MHAWFYGMTLQGGLIVAIGAQNAHVLKQGLRREQVAVTVLVCILVDVALIAIGALGMGQMVASVPWLAGAATWLGAAFLLSYGLLALWRALRGGMHLDAARSTPLTVRGAAMLALGFSVLNPHVWVDAVVLVGAVGASMEAHARLWFAGGAMTVSALWFILLGFGAHRAAVWLSSPKAWRAIDLTIGGGMCVLAVAMVR